MTVRVIADSTSYIPPEQAAALDIRVVPLSVTLGGVTQREDEVDPAPFYERMLKTSEFPTSSQPSVAAFLDEFEEALSRGVDAVAVVISSRMSGTYETADMARRQVLERYPARTIEIVDSRSNSMEEGFAVLAAARAAGDGAGVAGVVAAARHAIARTRWLFTPATLEYLRRGGRIGNAAALVGTVLRISPVLTVVDGVTAPYKQVRTHRRALETIADVAAADFAEKGFADAVVHHILAAEDGEDLATMIEQRSGHRPRVHMLGPAIGIHVGPGSLGVVYQTCEELHKNTPDP